jgi:putative FmdB family regulatory protein
MPIYEYQCKKCRHVCEVLQKAKDKPLEKCPKCGCPVVKLISSPAIQFKGNGWYITDYAKKTSPPASAKSEPKAATESRSGEEPKAKPASGEGAKPKSDKSSS